MKKIIIIFLVVFLLNIGNIFNVFGAENTKIYELNMKLAKEKILKKENGGFYIKSINERLEKFSKEELENILQKIPLYLEKNREKNRDFVIYIKNKSVILLKTGKNISENKENSEKISLKNYENKEKGFAFSYDKDLEIKENFFGYFFVNDKAGNNLIIQNLTSSVDLFETLGYDFYIEKNFIEKNSEAKIIKEKKNEKNGFNIYETYLENKGKYQKINLFHKKGEKFFMVIETYEKEGLIEVEKKFSQIIESLKFFDEESDKNLILKKFENNEFGVELLIPENYYEDIFKDGIIFSETKKQKENSNSTYFYGNTSSLSTLFPKQIKFNIETYENFEKKYKETIGENVKIEKDIVFGNKDSKIYFGFKFSKNKDKVYILNSENGAIEKFVDFKKIFNSIKINK